MINLDRDLNAALDVTMLEGGTLRFFF